ncbi:multidrug resistance protein 1 [[Clostridium] sordellii]|uniref:ABC transporter ATP-binding protein/permease n=1 Tax=Paraclostridium sordellii TaxID=1505 RepID=UPI0005DEEDC4|nr:ABC transporter ATP-binding protein/permease [Paeniclostridium sordellii]MDU4413307.1 ABC transporter ATP-binding protein/permease [Paeniclostridium sordellii]MRZ29046.1 ATP-binding cassette domain-containing protein [Paeniclostridium sordellii]MVO75160.1 ATP-binding cassette domain-containing protein [Paeniclostridium sordellii]CEO34479.1 multidrug resistance protein 1 [[Clostridium] sordellii] [Paeniclostridium sordellii]CEP93506.1 multidrug resistance protein 1 [[Clostridium] sordellii] 
MVNKRLLSLSKESKKYIYLTVLMNWISIICNIGIVLFVGNIIDKLFNKDFNFNIGIYTVYIGSLILTRFLCNYMSGRFSYYSSSKVRSSIRESIYKKLLELGVNYNETVSTSSIVQISVDGVEALEVYFGRYLPQLFYSLLAPLTLFLVIAQINFKAAIILLICVPLIPISIAAVMKFAKKLLSKYWGIYTNLGDSFLENLQGLTTLKIFDLDEEKNNEMNKEAETFRKITMKVLSMQLNSIIIMDIIAFGGAAIGILIAISEFGKGNITMGQTIIIILLSSEFFIPMRLLGSFFHVAMNGIAAADKIFNLLDTKVEKEKELPVELKNKFKNISISLSDVDFSYDKERTVLNNLNIEIKNKSMVALVGESGCGKSTITNLLLKLNKPDKGNIILNGINLNDISFDELRKKVSFISHSSYIFNSTIEENLRMGKLDASEEEMYRALKLANLYKFVINLEKKLQTPVGENGSFLSGGQKQRLALARMILTNPEVYIFDEATSNVDVESEDSILEAIYNIAKEKTVVVISHRLANIKNADKIYVLDKGYIVESGNHESLMNNNSTYANLYKNQENLENIYNEEVIEEVAISEQ